MLPIKCSNYQRNDVVSQCPIKICVITVVILGALLPLMTVLAEENIRNPSFSLIQMTSHYLPSETVAESLQSPRLLTITKASSTTGTTSTVRPWPSHTFFRSVLSKTDNVVVKKTNGSQNTRKSHETGVSSQKDSTSHMKDQKRSYESLHSNHVGNNKKLSTKRRVQKKGHSPTVNLRKVNESVPTVISNGIQPTSHANDTRARSALIPMPPENTPANSSSVTERKFSHEEMQVETMLKPAPEDSTYQQNGNVAKFSEPENLILNKTEKSSNEYSHINSPQFGFQYEIVLPPIVPNLPRPSPSKMPMNATSNNTTASTKNSSALQYKDSSESSSDSSSNYADDRHENKRNTSNQTISAVIVNDMKKKVTNADTTTRSPPLPLESQVEGSENADKATKPALSSSYNQSNEMILQNSQYPSSSLLASPPTQPLQLDMHLVKNIGGKSESITYNNKSSLPSTSSAVAHLENVNGIHTEIKNNDLLTITHNSSNANRPYKASPPETATFLPLLKRDRKQNSSSVTTLTSSNAEPTATTKIYQSYTTYASKPQPTQFPFQPTSPSVPDQIIKMDEKDLSRIEKPNQQFQKRISLHTDYHRKKADNANTNYPNIHGEQVGMEQQTVLIKRRNMFTVVKAGLTNPKIYVESRNITMSTTTFSPELNKVLAVKKSRPPAYPFDKLLYDRTNQMERPFVTPSLLTGPDRMVMSASPGYNGEKDNDYFDEDDTQVKLHHWIESEQGQFVTPSTELPRFTNLTWPYIIPNSDSDASNKNAGKTGVDGTGNAADSPASTALAVSFNSQRKDKPDFNTQFEFYIPSAAADPQQNPILLAKKQANKTSQASYERWTTVPSFETFTAAQKPENGKQEQNYLKQSDHKSKIKHSHWGSNGLSSINRQNSQNVKYATSQNQSSKMKVDENSMNSPKSSTTSFPSLTFTKNPGASTFSIHSSKRKNYILTSPSTLGSSWPFGSTDGVVGHSETASFVTPKTPTNIWYKPIINHFTASVPFNGSTALFESVNNQMFNNAHGIGGGAPVTTTMQPPSTRRQGYVGGNEGDTFQVNTNKIDKTIPGKFPFSMSDTKSPETDNGETKRRILFKVWNLVDGKLKLETQREIPAWALDGYLIPASGTILNLQQIPQAIQPLVTSAMAVNKETECKNVSNANDLSYIWKELPILGSKNVPQIPKESTTTTTTTKPTTTTRPTRISTTTRITPDQSSFDKDYNQVKPTENKVGWQAETEIMHSSSKQPISINYVLWNNPASIYGQSIILSTPTPQTLLSHRPTPVSYFPSSTITPGENAPQYSVPSVVTIKNPGNSGNSNSHITTTTPRTSPSINMDQEKLELLFQNYFQYFITTSTPAPITTTTTARPVMPVSLADKVTGVYGGQPDNTNAWKDLKKLILRLATTKTDHSNDQASATPDKDKTGDLDYLGNVAAIALIMSYIRNQYEQGTRPQSTTPAPYGVTDDMTPPNKDQLWATVYPLFQHYLNNPNYTFIPPPPQSFNHQLLSESSSSLASMTPTSTAHILFTEPLTITGSSDNYNAHNTEYNHYASYYPTITTFLPTMVSHKSHIVTTTTEVPMHGATTENSLRSDDPLSYLDDEFYSDLEVVTTTTRKPKTHLRFNKSKKKNKKKRKKLSKSALAATLFGGGLLKKKLPLFNLKKKPKKYWLDLKFEIDFIQILKKKLLFLLAYKYMPVAMVLAFGVTPVVLSLVPLIYKFAWQKLKKPKYIKVPVPYPSPYPVTVYKHPPPYFHDHHYPHHHGSYSPSDGHTQQGPEIGYENGYDHNNGDVINVDSPPQMDHHYAADTTGSDNSQEDPNRYSHKGLEIPTREGNHRGVVNSFNYDHVRHATPNTHAGNGFQQFPYNGYQPEQEQEVHVHLHDDESRLNPQFYQAPITPSPYTSYTREDLQPYPATKSYEIGFDIGKTLAGITNKHDMEIFKILVETKKEKLGRLLEMWNLAKYGAAVASEAALTAIRGPTTPTYTGEDVPVKKKKRKRRRRRRKKRKQSNDNVLTLTNHSNVTVYS